MACDGLTAQTVFRRLKAWTNSLASTSNQNSAALAPRIVQAYEQWGEECSFIGAEFLGLLRLWGGEGGMGAGCFRQDFARTDIEGVVDES